MTNNRDPIPIDQELEWYVLAHIHAGYLAPDAIRKTDVTCERQLTLARINAGTCTSWELAAFDLLPAVADSEIREQVEQLRDLGDRRRMWRELLAIEAGLENGSLSATDAACELRRVADHA